MSGAFLDGLTDRRWVLLVAALVLPVYLATATYDTNQITDTGATAVQAWRLAETGTPWLDDLQDTPHLIRRNDHWVTNRLPGSVALGVVAYTLARPLLDDAPVASSRDVPMWPAGIAEAAATAAAIAVLSLAFRRFLREDRLAAGATLALAFGTATWSVSANALWTHTVTELGLAVAVLGLVAGANVRTGLGLATAVLARTHVALIAAGAGIGRALDDRRWRTVVVVGVISAVGLAAAMAYGRWLYGEPSPTVGYTGYTSRVTQGGTQDSLLAQVGNWLLLLVHPTRGLLPTTPFLVPLVVGLPAAWRGAPQWARGLALGALAQLTIQALVNPYTGGDAFFGSRLTLELLVATTPLWLLAYRHVRTHERLRVATHAALGASIVYHALGATVLSKGVLGA